MPPRRRSSYNDDVLRDFRRSIQPPRRQRRSSPSGQSRWTPRGSENPDVGILEGTDHVVSFKTGGPNGNETLIADGDYSTGQEAKEEFRRGHDHYGSKAEGGWIDKVRGFFTDPNR